MGFLGRFVRGLLNVFCVSSPQQEAPEPVYPSTSAGKPPSQQIQHPGGYSAQYQYPPPQQQQQQWQPPQQPLRPRPHKPYHGHSQGQSQGSPQRPFPIQSPPPPPAPQNQWTSPRPPPVAQPAQAAHPASSRPPHVRLDQKFVNSQNEHYVSLRDRANREGEAMARAFELSHAAYARKDGAGAKEFSNEGKAHQREMERLNAEASAWIFRENNRDCNLGEVDLHGLYVKEAIAYTDQSIAEARARGDKELRLIVGKGIHSPNHAAKLKPAIEKLMHKYDLTAAIDPQNSGVLIVQLEGGTAAEQVQDQGGLTLGPDDITQRLDRKNGDCIIM